MNFVFGLLIFGAVGIYIKRGAFAAAATFLMTFLALMAAFNYYPLVQWCVVWIVPDLLGAYSGALGLFVVFLAVFSLLQYGAMSIMGETIDINPIVNGMAGAFFGALIGLLLAGFLSITWLMMPGSGYYLNTEGNQQPKVVLNADEDVLSVVRFIANDRLTGSSYFDPTGAFMRSNSYKFSKATQEAPAPFMQQPSDESPDQAPQAIAKRNRALKDAGDTSK